MAHEIKINVGGLIYNQSVVGTYGLLLYEKAGNRRFSIMIGEPEAQSIALKLNNKKSPRPLTHDLILTLLSVFGAKLEKVLIYDMVNDVFYSELYLQKGEMSLVVDARTSDAIALAVRAECDIFIKEEILNIVGMEIGVTEQENPHQDEEIERDIEQLDSESLDTFSLKELETLLDKAIREEKYELAVSLRDAIKRKKSI